MGDVEAVRDFLENEDKSDVPLPEQIKLLGKSDRNLSETAEETRGDEYKWFMENTKGLEERELAALVAHRGFVSVVLHCILYLQYMKI